LDRAVLIEAVERDPEVVALGDVLTLTDAADGKVLRVQLVSPDEVMSGAPGTAPGMAQVSSASPVGLAVLSARVGSSVTLQAGKRELQYEVTAIETER